MPASRTEPFGCVAGFDGRTQALKIVGNWSLDVFEAFVTMCMLAAAGPVTPLPGETCRIALLPGFAAGTKAACERASRLVARQPAGVKAKGLPFCAPRPSSVLAFSEAVPGVFVHRGKVEEPNPANVGDVSNIAFVVGSRSIAVIDAGGSRKVGEEIYLAIRERSALPITHLILTHMHPDHVLGAEPLREAGAAIIGHANLRGHLPIAPKPTGQILPA